MLVFTTVIDLQKHLNSLRKTGKKIGFAPTMGALHTGHVSLIRLAKEKCDIAVCSIFVNPTQFNDPKDLEKYPRTPDEDILLLSKNGCDVLFMPNVKEVYPSGLELKATPDFGSLATVMEGEFRPGHFDGMARVVQRLLDIVQPDQLFMGQKDFQQFSIVANMLHQQHTDIQLVMCPTLREADGLAMSSRNIRLSPDHRLRAALIYKTLQEVRHSMSTKTPSELKKKAFETLQVAADFRPEYFEIVDGNTLQPIQNFANHTSVVACVATWLGAVRLIDNIILK